MVELFEIPMLCLPDFRFVVLYSNAMYIGIFR